MANKRKATFAKQTVEEKKYPAEEFFEEKGPKETKKNDKSTVEKAVNKSVRLNLRNVPSVEGAVIKILEPGTKLSVLDEGPEWSNVELGDGDKKVKGYVMTKFIE